MTVIKKLEAFAKKHDIRLSTKGEVGFGRPCVGFLKGTGYIDMNPNSFPDYKPVFDEQNLDAPVGVDSYHKHECLCVLVRDDDYDEGLSDLLIWVEDLESTGELEVVEYSTGAEGMQAKFSGTTGYALKFKEVS